MDAQRYAQQRPQHAWQHAVDQMIWLAEESCAMTLRKIRTQTADSGSMTVKLMAPKAEKPNPEKPDIRAATA